MIAVKQCPRPKAKGFVVAKRMTIAAGMICSDGVVFGADTDESIGDMRRRVHKIPILLKPSAMITGTCLNSHLMDTAVHRIFRELKKGEAKDSGAVEGLLGEVMVGLYRREFKVYPDQDSISMQLLVAVKPEDDDRAEAWVVDCSAVLPMRRRATIVGYGEVVQHVADHLYMDGMSVENGVLAMVQVLSAAKKRAQFVGGESYVHTLGNNGALGGTNFSFSPEKEDLYEFFIERGRQLLIATGTPAVTADEYDKLAAKFIADLKWKRKKICR